MNNLLGLPSLAEDLAADGFRTFTVSQYFPCNVNLLVGCQSDTVYRFDYALLRRSGSMTHAQRLKRQELDRLVRFDPRATEASFSQLLDTVVSLSVHSAPAPRTLYTVRHPAYRAAWQLHPHIQNLKRRQLLHRLTVSSRSAGTASNPLRAVNYLDREIRKDRADHHRESGCFGRNVCAMLGRLAVYFVYHNMMKSPPVHGSRSPGALETILESHAQHASGAPKELTPLMVKLVSQRRLISREVLPEFYQKLWRKQIPTPLKRGREYLPKYALA